MRTELGRLMGFTLDSRANPLDALAMALLHGWRGYRALVCVSAQPRKARGDLASLLARLQPPAYPF
jgi:hypothetical protein